MKTDYYCKACNEFFFEEALPNMNKLHACGQLARIAWHRDEAKRA